MIVKSRILVKPNAGLSDAQLDKILAGHGARRVRHLQQIGVHIVELPATANEMAVVKALRSNPHIKFAEPDGVVGPNLYVNDPYFGNQWHLPKIGAPTAWDARTGSGVTIAILDSGIDVAHPDLAPQLVAGWNVFDNNSNLTDVSGHGTKVGGAAAAAGNNSVGVSGVSFGSRIMPIRITDPSGYAYYSTIASGLTWAADHGARVANISYSPITSSSTVLNAAQYMRSKGGVVVNSAGNTGALEPYAKTDLITVAGATDSSNNVTTFSSYGDFVSVAAPGVSIYSTIVGGGYGAVSGTSFASPVIAGVYALMISANPSLPSTQLDSILFSTASDIGTAGKDQKSGWGMVNAGAAVTKARQTTAIDSTAPSISISSPTASSTLTNLATVSVSASDNVGVTRTELYVNNSLYASDPVAPYTFSLDTNALPDGSATLLAKAFDAAGNASSATVSVKIANDTTAPAVSVQSPTNGSTVTGTVTVSATATDNKKVAKVALSIDGNQVSIAYGSSLSYSWNTGSKVKGGRKGTQSPSSPVARSLTVTATDEAGNTAQQSLTVYSQ
jgi:subtilisin family serine protease